MQAHSFDLFTDLVHAPPVTGRRATDRIEALATEVARRAPALGGVADEIRALLPDLHRGPTRDEIVEAVEGVCDDISGACAARIAEAVARLLRTGR